MRDMSEWLKLIPKNEASLTERANLVRSGCFKEFQKTEKGALVMNAPFAKTRNKRQPIAAICKFSRNPTTSATNP